MLLIASRKIAFELKTQVERNVCTVRFQTGDAFPTCLLHQWSAGYVGLCFICSCIFVRITRSGQIPQSSTSRTGRARRVIARYALLVQGWKDNTPHTIGRITPTSFVVGRITPAITPHPSFCYALQSSPLKMG